MTKEELQQRIAGIRSDMEILKANFSKLEGHLEESNFWLNDILIKEAEANKEEDDTVPEDEIPQEPQKTLADLHQSE